MSHLDGMIQSQTISMSLQWQTKIVKAWKGLIVLRPSLRILICHTEPSLHHRYVLQILLNRDVFIVYLGH